MRFCSILLLWAICQNASAQGYDFLYQYFEADSTEMPGCSSIKVQTTETNSMRPGAAGKISITESFYDRAGKLVAEEQTSSIAPATIRTSFGYDSISGRMNYIVRTGGKAKQEDFAQYDEMGRLSEIVHCQEDNPCRMRHYVYDEDNTEQVYIPRQTIELQFGKGEKPKSLFGISAANTQKDELARERFFDLEGKLEEVRLYSNGAFSVGWIFEYNMAGQKTKTWAINSTEKKLLNDHEYDEKGRLATEKTYLWVVGSKLMPYPETESSITHFEYDDKNRLVRTEEGNKRYSKIQEFTYYEN